MEEKYSNFYSEYKILEKSQQKLKNDKIVINMGYHLKKFIK